MNILKYFLSIATLSCAGCVQHVDGGGLIWDYKKEMLEARTMRREVSIDYECDSACLIRLSSGPGLCISKKAKFGVHEPHFAPGNIPYSQGFRVEEFVQLFKDLLPLCAVRLFDGKRAFDRPKLTYFSGEEVLQSCPEIKECVG